MLEVIGVNVSDDVKNYVMDEHLDWIKLEKHLDEDCVLPMNVFRQMIEKLQNQECAPSGVPPQNSPPSKYERNFSRTST